MYNIQCHSWVELMDKQLCEKRSSCSDNGIVSLPRLGGLGGSLGLVFRLSLLLHTTTDRQIVHAAKDVGDSKVGIVLFSVKNGLDGWLTRLKRVPGSLAVQFDNNTNVHDWLLDTRFR